ncbi:beta-mannosidase [Inconstantimicrobium mannanitabidum]|uniref:Beta-mannosidase n=1 Tax=Inconstantimicrobium mannanitabidum TaxID=1604901 RepID=A0ACB5R7Z8_9CLOT|nr:sugar-binding domain-containing protein [Clostridium sp. TW13]GKX65313.1 beta-mannosidase [Clostridium sp. TW13]
MSKVKQHQSYGLSGEWRLILQDVGRGNLQQAIDLYEDGNTIECKVPGDVHIALTEAGVIEDPLIDLNGEDCRWLEEKEFWYIKVFDIEEDFVQDYEEITFEGLDLTSDIWLNNKYIGCHNNAFIGKTIDITSNIKVGKNLLVVRIDDGVNSVKEKPIELMKYSWNNDQPYRVWMRKPQYVYGWDWTIWLPTCGIWKDVHIDSYHKAYINDVYIETQFEGNRISKADNISLGINIELKALKNEKYTLQCELYKDGRYDDANSPISICSKDVILEASIVNYNMKLEIKEPNLWWPNKSGMPYLYCVKVQIKDNEGKIIDTSVRKHGLRTVEIDKQDLGDNQKSFTFKINDNLIFVKGANHVPADCLLGRITDEKDRRILEAAADANMNMIRVWGGGVYASEAFMDGCDELGLMVWHDFMFACGYYPDYDEKFYEEIKIEATVAIKRLRNHVSLVGWSGNNEIQEMYTSAKEYHEELPWYGGRFYEELLPSLVKSLCSDRIYRESSPYGGDMPASYEEGDQHTWHFTHRPNWEHYLDLWRFTDFDFKFLSEFGIIGAMNIESAKKCIKAEAFNPDSHEWLYHTNTTSEHQLLNIIVNKYFGDCSKMDIQEYILKSQVIQAEIMRHIYDELRARKFRCSGILLWTLSDSYGIHNWSVIDYYLGKRPVYYYLKRSMAPLGLTLKGYEAQNFDGMANYKKYYKGEVKPIEVTVINDTLEDKDVFFEYRILTVNGQVLKSGEIAQNIEANSTRVYANIDFSDIKKDIIPEETFLHAKISCEGETLNENRYFFAPYNKLNLSAADIECTVNRISDIKVKMKLQSTTFVWMLHLATPDGINPSDNDFDLISNEAKYIEVEVENAENYMPEFFSLNPRTKVKIINDSKCLN